MFTLLLLPLASVAQADSVVALSASDRAAALDRAARGDETLPLNGQPRAIHGEIGMEVGSHGTRALYGTTVVPIGETGSAAVSFLTARSNGWRAR